MLIGLFVFLPTVNAASGDLDTSFSNDGKVVDTLLVRGNAQGQATAIQADGKIVVAGTLTIGNNGGTIPQRFGCAIARYNTNGSFDTTFDDDGRTVGLIGTGFTCRALAIQTDGKIIVGGGTASSGNSDFAVMRFNSNGLLDTSFGTDGKRVFDMFPGSNDFFYGMTLDSSGKAVMIGETNPANDTTKRIAVARILTDFASRRSLFDFDGDGKTDISIFRPAQGEWWYLKSSDGGNRAFVFSNSADKLVPGDYTGDGKTDAAVFRPSTGEWFVLRSEDNSFYSVPFGISGDSPTPGDYDGDGKFDFSVFRPSSATWYINRSTSGILIINYGLSGDKPVPSAFVP